ncbi:FxDxF family PEP-CTERM protein [Paucibacter sp. B2R-40]|uniref:FxDxF family PEP-CTERM protein n=1 Tax=Paucibacter sp. B2R-40 TaxID=2893554 RepID=UPI0021E4BA4D|nr:FxDxF family PEP-CTERM protein [Paucibacter sp. B2R-40]MCV2356634.1 FxDxF family PEP-CTERM protein [Paucibacter sp. B2R-40]
MALALLAGATSALAGPVLTLAPDWTFGNAAVSGSKNGFSDIVKTLHVDGNQMITAYLATKDQMLDIKGVSFVKLGAQGAPDESTRLAFTETLAVDWTKQEGTASERWERSPVRLSAGEWQLEVTGLRRSKSFGAYSGAVQADSQVPEPQTLALSLLALAAMAGLARRRKLGR